MSFNQRFTSKLPAIALLSLALTVSSNAAIAKSELDRVTRNIIWDLCESDGFRQCVAEQSENEIDTNRSCRSYFDSNISNATRVRVLKTCLKK